MSEEKTAGASSKTKHTRDDASARAGDSLSSPKGSPQVLEARTYLGGLAGRPAQEVLARIGNGDPLRIYSQTAHRIRDTYFLLDPDRVFERALAVIAVGIEVEAEACVQPGWLVEMIDRAIRQTLDGDSEGERAGIPPENPREHFRVFVEAFFVEPSLARLSAVRVNGLEERIRKGFYHLIVEGRPLEEVLTMGLGPPEQLQRDVLVALKAIGLIDERGFEELLGKERPS